MEFTYSPPGQMRAGSNSQLANMQNVQQQAQQQQQVFANLQKMNQQQSALPVGLDPNLQAQLQAFAAEQLLNAQLQYDVSNNQHMFMNGQMKVQDFSTLEGNATLEGGDKPGPVRRPRAKKNRDDPMGGGAPVRDDQNKERHNASEQRRREKLNKLMDDLKALLPECKNSKFTILDKAIQHIKGMQIQSIQYATTNKMLEEENSRLSKMLQSVKSNIQLGPGVLTASGNINNVNANNGETPVNAAAAATTMATLLAQSNFQQGENQS